MFGSNKKTLQEALDIRIHGTVTVGTKGQIVIPKEIRDMLNLNE